MKNSSQEKVSDLKASAASKEEFMSKLAQMETGHVIPTETLANINGGVGTGKLIEILGIFIGEVFGA